MKLTRDLGVNLAGVEIILNMREKMAAMQRQIETFVATLNQELAQRASRPTDEGQHSLIPVIQMVPASGRQVELASRSREQKIVPDERAQVATSIAAPPPEATRKIGMQERTE